MINTTRDIARELARKYSTMTHDELDLLESILVPMKFAKGAMVLNEGEVCKNIYYIDKGLLRQFYYKNDKELTEHLGVENTIVMCIESLFREEPTHLLVEALEPSFMPFRNSVWSRWLCIMSIFRFFIARFSKRVSFFRKYTRTLFVLSLHRIVIKSCVN